ncbi:hypothetical protein BJX70DRAFT_356509 [Aspergillus crustosus]
MSIPRELTLRHWVIHVIRFYALHSWKLYLVNFVGLNDRTLKPIRRLFMDLCALRRGSTIHEARLSISCCRLRGGDSYGWVKSRTTHVRPSRRGHATVSIKCVVPGDPRLSIRSREISALTNGLGAHVTLNGLLNLTPPLSKLIQPLTPPPPCPCWWEI